MHLLARYRDVLRVNWHVGLTAFGGPAVQFQTVRNINVLTSSLADPQLVSPTIRGAFTMDRRTNGKERSSKQTRTTVLRESQYQQIFAVSQALPGSASVKMLFCINTIHGGFSAGTLAILMFR